MKTTFPKKSQPHEEKIRQIADIIVSCGKDKIAFVILFGSFARGTWVLDVKQESDGNTYEYASDYDFLIITKTPRQAIGRELFALEKKIDKLLKAQGLLYGYKNHDPHYIVEPIKKINSALENGQYFFSDIKKEGILLYNSGEFQFSEVKEIGEKAKRRIAGEDYEYWIGNAETKLEDFYSNLAKSAKGKKYLNNAAFLLHQATENFYACALLVLTGYKPKTHDLTKLGYFCSVQSNDFLTIFPLATDEQKECFELLRKAYIDARYSKEYAITKEQLEYLIGRVEKLKGLVEGVCGDKI